MHQAQRAHGVRIGQLVVKLRDLRSQQQSFIDDGARRERGNIKEAFVRKIGRGNFRFRALADHVELALQLDLRSSRKRRE